MKITRILARRGYLGPDDGVADGGNDGTLGTGPSESLDDIVGAVDEGEEEDTGERLELPGDERDDDGPQDAAEDPGKDVDPEDPDEEWTDGETKLKAKRSELRAAFKEREVLQARVQASTQAQQQVAEFATAVQQRFQAAVTQVDSILAWQQSQMQAMQPKAELIETDPQEYMRQITRFNAAAQQFQGALQHRQTLVQQAEAVSVADRQRIAQLGAQRLLDALPTWRDPGVRSAEMGKANKVLQAVGYTPDEIGAINDHRTFLLASDANKWRELQALKQNKPAAGTAKPVTKPATRTMRPGPSQASAPRVDNVVKIARQRLDRNPSDFKSLVGLVGALG